MSIKKFLIALSVLAFISAPALAEKGHHGNMDDKGHHKAIPDELKGKIFEKIKATKIEHLDENISLLKEKRNCFEAAQEKTAFKACKENYKKAKEAMKAKYKAKREEMKAKRKNKKGKHGKKEDHHDKH